MIRKVSDSYLRKAAVVVAMATVCVAVGCSPDPDPPPQPEELTLSGASALITQKWSHDELNHFTVNFHSDTLIACGLQNDLWKRVETPFRGFKVVTYQLTEAGRKALFAIDLKESGKSHEIILQGPYAIEVTGVTPGSQPDTRQAAILWNIDWDKAPAGLKACFPRGELSGSQVALFKLDGLQWSLSSFLHPEEATTPAQPTEATIPSIIRQ
jgi:hypothetical protein